MDIDAFSADFVRRGVRPGPNNLREPVAALIRGHGALKRREITRALEDSWRRVGGRPVSGQEWGSAAEREAWEHRVKPVLRKLNADRKIRPETGIGGKLNGRWEWVVDESPPAASPGEDQAEVSVGTGKYLCYGLYSQQDKSYAEARGETCWPIKVGKTRAHSPYQRIQDPAFLREKPVWGVAVRTDEPDKSETLIKGALDLRGRRLAGTYGKEWYLTSPTEIAEIYSGMIGGSA